jgi:hypothetical protein
VESSQRQGDPAVDEESLVGGEDDFVMPAGRRQWLIQPLVRSTTHRRGWTTKPVPGCGPDTTSATATVEPV